MLGVVAPFNNTSNFVVKDLLLFSVVLTYTSVLEQISLVLQKHFLFPYVLSCLLHTALIMIFCFCITYVA
jgi:hypothetical protein